MLPLLVLLRPPLPITNRFCSSLSHPEESGTELGEWGWAHGNGPAAFPSIAGADLALFLSSRGT